MRSRADPATGNRNPESPQRGTPVAASIRAMRVIPSVMIASDVAYDMRT